MARMKVWRLVDFGWSNPLGFSTFLNSPPPAWHPMHRDSLQFGPWLKEVKSSKNAKVPEVEKFIQQIDELQRIANDPKTFDFEPDPDTFRT